MVPEEIEERDILFCELLFECGSVAQASKQLGLSIRQGRKIATKRKQDILDMTELELSSLAFKAVSTVRQSLDEDGSIPKSEVRLKAAEGILDRIGASKKTTSEVEIIADRPVILMPAKDKLVQPVISVTTEP